MSMRKEYVAVAPEELPALISNADWFDVVESYGKDSRLNLDKAWHGLHFLITGTQWEAEPPLGLAILVGMEFGDDLGYGRPRYLDADTVKSVAAALAELRPEQLESRYVPSEMGDVYPGVWEQEGGEGLKWLLAEFKRLTEFFAHSAARGMAIAHFVA